MVIVSTVPVHLPIKITDYYIGQFLHFIHVSGYHAYHYSNPVPGRVHVTSSVSMDLVAEG